MPSGDEVKRAERAVEFLVLQHFGLEVCHASSGEQIHGRRVSEDWAAGARRKITSGAIQIDFPAKISRLFQMERPDVRCYEAGGKRAT